VIVLCSGQLHQRRQSRPRGLARASPMADDSIMTLKKQRGEFPRIPANARRVPSRRRRFRQTTLPPTIIPSVLNALRDSMASHFDVLLYTVLPIAALLARGRTDESDMKVFLASFRTRQRALLVNLTPPLEADLSRSASCEG
jgi:hypothetical protein